MKMQVRFEGGRELETALSTLASQYRRKKAARDALMEAAEPIHAAAEAKAPVRMGGKEKRFKIGERSLVRRRGALKSHINLGTRLSRRQSIMNRPNKMPVEVYIGTRDRMGRLVEFGTRNTRAQPFLRGAWDALGGQRALATISTALWKQISRQTVLAARAAKRGKL